MTTSSSRPLLLRLGTFSLLFFLSMQSKVPCYGQTSAPAAAQAHALRLVDTQGRAIAGATVVCNEQRYLSDQDGRVSLPRSCTHAQISASGFTSLQPLLHGPSVLTLTPQIDRQQLTVTAARGAVLHDAGSSSVRILDASALNQSAAFTLDDRLRQVAGVELYRRTPSWVANPTTQGISLRGLGSTAASRTLITSDEVPMNDPFGGWVHWNEIPKLAIENVEVLRGGASDLYGSSAIGGVVTISPLVPDPAAGFHYVVDAGYGGLTTPFGDAVLTDGHKGWSALASSGLLRTDGYILTTPESRGLVDVPYNVHQQDGRAEIRHTSEGGASYFARANLLNEARDNGTPLQTNATRLWRYAVGSNLVLPRQSALSLRVFGSDQGYRQSFTTIAADRNSERLTRLQRVPSQEIGLATRSSTQFSQLQLIGGIDLRDIRATDAESPVSNGLPTAATRLSVRQRATGGYLELLWSAHQWSAALAGRVDRFSTFDGTTTAPGASPTALPTDAETLFNPHLGLARQLSHGFSLSGSVFRAFRGPTLNELYRNGQVGQELTLANNTLRSERATGFEFGVAETLPGIGSLHASYFQTQVNRPITALTLAATPTFITKQRANLGQIVSQGLSVDYVLNPTSWLSLDGGYQYANATVTRFDQDPTLVGLWIPEVARHVTSTRVQLARASLGTLSLLARTSGRMYDDASNMYLLHGFTRFDVYASRHFGQRFEIYTSVQNLFDRSIEAGRTPVLTLGTPRTALIGARFYSGR